MLWSERLSRAARAMLAIVAVVFVSELGVMLVVGHWLGSSAIGRLAVLDALALALIIAPAVYFIVLRPLRREGERRLEAQRRARRADRLARTDSLTRVWNRRGIQAGLLEAMYQAERYGRPLSVAMLDLDGFKRVNDLHGHACGDGVLRRAAEVVGEQLRSSDRIGRYGGDEFLIVLPETDLAAAKAMSDRIVAAIRKTEFQAGQRSLTLSASLGLVEFRQGESFAALLDRVDERLYAAKARARSPRLGERAATP